jgi:hypothetical protein
MDTEKSVGRTLGVLILLHLAAGLIVPFALLHRLRVPPGFLVTAAGMPNRVRVSVLLLFAGSALAIAIACAALQVFRQYSSAMAYWLLALAVASFSLQAMDNANLLSMLSLSQEYASAAPGNRAAFQTLAIAVAAARKWPHYCFLLVVVCWIFLLCAFLYRYRLVPRALAGFGMITCVLQMAGVTLRGFWGLPPETRLAMPLAPAYGALAIWLMVKGLDKRLESPIHGSGGMKPGASTDASAPRAPSPGFTRGTTV